MKQKILASIALMIFMIGGVMTPAFSLLIPKLQPGISYAQFDWNTQNNNDSNPNLQAPQIDNTNITPDPTNETAPQVNGGDQIVTTTPGDAIPTSISGSIPEQTPQEAQGSKSLCGAGEFACGLLEGVAEIIRMVPTSLAIVSGMGFDYTVWWSLQSGTYTAFDGTPTNEGFVTKGWKLVRDFTNLVFIFALFVIGFTLILGLDGGEKVSLTSNPKRTIARVIMMALLVNFSFFMGRFVITVTNKFALQFYTNMTGAPKMEFQGSQGSVATADVNSFYAQNPGMRGISAAIISKVNPQKFLLDESGSQAGGGAGKYANLFFLAFVAGIFGLFLAYIFLSITILFLARTIGLFLGIIISPIAFVSYTVPMLQKTPYIGWDDWLKQFFGLAFMAPIFLFFLYISIQFFDIPITTGSGQTTIAASVLFKFAVITMLLTFAKRMAQDMSGKIGGMATGLVTGALTATAAVGAAVATGGTSAGLQMARQQAKQGAIAIGNNTLGEERTMALRQSFNKGFKDFRMLPTNPGRAMLGFTGAVTGSSVPGQINKSIDEGNILGTKVNRAKNIKNIREERLAKEEADRKAKAAQDLADKKQAADAAEAERKKNEVRAKYNYDERKKAQEARDAAKAANGGKSPTLGDGSAQKPEYTEKQQERILNQAIAAEEKRNKNTPTGGTAQTKPPVTGDTTSRPKTTFNGNADFDRPKTSSGLVDQYGNPISSNPNAAQQEESAKLTGIYNKQQQEDRETIHVDNLAVKNLKIEPSVQLPSRKSNGDLSPQKQAATLLSGIQMAPKATSGALNYKTSDLKNTTTSSPDYVDQIVGGLVDNKQSEIKKIESDRKEFLNDVNNLGKLDDASTKKALHVLDEYDKKKAVAYNELKDIKNTSASGSIDQSNIIDLGGNGNLDFGGMGPRGEHDEQ